VDTIAGTVTLKEGWRARLLPGIDTRLQKRVPLGGHSLADSIIALSSKATKIDSKQKTKFNYESSRIQSVVNETNIHGR